MQPFNAVWHPQSSQVWSYDEKGVSPEGSSYSQVYVGTVEIVDGVKIAKRHFKSTSAEKAAFWTTIGLYTRADGQCPKPPLVVHQAERFTANLSENLDAYVFVYCNKSGMAFKIGVVALLLCVSIAIIYTTWFHLSNCPIGNSALNYDYMSPQHTLPLP